MDRAKLLAAIFITTVLLCVFSLVLWLAEKTDGLIFLVLMIISIVAVVYATL